MVSTPSRIFCSPVVSPTVEPMVSAPVRKKTYLLSLWDFWFTNNKIVGYHGWLTVEKDGRMTQFAEPQFQIVPRTDTSKVKWPQTYAIKTTTTTTTTTTLTTTKSKFVSPNRENFEKLLEIKKQLDEAKSSAFSKI